LAPKYAGGRPPKFTLPERREIEKIALSRPLDQTCSSRPGACLSKLAEFLVAEGVDDDISHEDLRLVLRGVSLHVTRETKPATGSTHG
jgi:hypothetical protein